MAAGQGRVHEGTRAEESDPPRRLVQLASRGPTTREEARAGAAGHHIVAPVLADRPAIGAATCGMFLSGASALLTPVRSILGKRFAAAVQV